MLFKVGDTDYTRKIRQNTYQVNTYDSYSEWTDANYRIHRSVVRSQLSGSFTMYFGTQAEFDTFIQSLPRHNGGYVTVGLFSNNKLEWREGVDVFMDFAPARQQKIIGEAWYPELKVTVKEC